MHQLAPEHLHTLTPRERQVLALMAAGHSSHGISEQLSLRKKTVESHVRNIFSKLRLHESAADEPRVLAVLRYLGLSAVRANSVCALMRGRIECGLPSARPDPRKGTRILGSPLGLVWRCLRAGTSKTQGRTRSMRNTRAIARLTAMRARGVGRLLPALSLLAAIALAPAPTLGQTASAPVLLDMSPAVATPGSSVSVSIDLATNSTGNNPVINAGPGITVTNQALVCTLVQTGPNQFQCNVNAMTGTFKAGAVRTARLQGVGRVAGERAAAGALRLLLG